MNDAGALSHVRVVIKSDQNSALKSLIEWPNSLNTFVHINHWVKGEELCLEALNEGEAKKEELVERKRDTDKEIVSLTESSTSLSE